MNSERKLRDAVRFCCNRAKRTVRAFEFLPDRPMWVEYCFGVRRDNLGRYVVEIGGSNNRQLLGKCETPSEVYAIVAEWSDSAIAYA